MLYQNHKRNYWIIIRIHLMNLVKSNNNKMMIKMILQYKINLNQKIKTLC